MLKHMEILILIVYTQMLPLKLCENTDFVHLDVASVPYD